MKADLTRDTFHPARHFSQVLMQQGRVQLDADWNEQSSIFLRYLRTLTTDLVGRASGTPGSFVITPLGISPTPTDDFRISEGHFYVDGILCEAASTPIGIYPLTPPATDGTVLVDRWTIDGMELQDAAWSPQQGVSYLELFDDIDGANPPRAAAFAPVLVKISSFNKANGKITIDALPDISTPARPKLRRIFTYLHQPGFVFSNQPNNPVPPAFVAPAQVYLDVWERLITYLEDDAIREVALGGPDTATRAQVVWQVRITPALADGSCMSVAQLNALLQPPNRGYLKARAKQGSQSTDPCIIDPSASYQGAENQLYRVEINRPGAAWDGGDAGESTAATFKWSRENGSVAFAISSGGGTGQLVLESLGRDDRFGLSVGDWVEVQDDSSVLLSKPGTLLQVHFIDTGSLTVMLDGTPDPTVGSNPALHPVLRRWDLQAGDPEEGGLTLGSDNAALVQEGIWLELEDGVQVLFQPSVPGALAQSYRTADYWMIPARIATGDVEWPRMMTAGGVLDTDASGNPIPLALPPHGVTHHYAPLGVVSIPPRGGGVVAGDPCSESFPTLVELEAGR